MFRFAFAVVLAILYGVSGQFTDDRKRRNDISVEPFWTRTEQLLDNFDPLEDRTFYTRNLENDQFFTPGGPLVVYIGGEWEIENAGAMGGMAFQIAKKHRGYIFYPEHRYYGKSFPPSYSDENESGDNEKFRHFTFKQALADLANAIYRVKKRVVGLENSQTIVVGGSYAGTMAIYARLQYPHLINMVYSCGPVILDKFETRKYNEVVWNAYVRTSKQCSSLIRQAFQEADSLFSTEGGRKKLAKLFKGQKCLGQVDRTNYTATDMKVSMFNLLNIQVAYPHDIFNSCDHLLYGTGGTPLERFIQAIPTFSKAYGVSKRKCKYKGKDWTIWNWLVCNELGNVPTFANSSIFGDFKRIKETTEERCTKTFGPRYTLEEIMKRRERHRYYYATNFKELTKTVLVQGTLDPWGPQSILDETNKDVRVITIEGATHCSDLGEQQPEEDHRIVQSKLETLEVLSQWID